jgi:hypothetical protein
MRAVQLKRLNALKKPRARQIFFRLLVSCLLAACLLAACSSPVTAPAAGETPSTAVQTSPESTPTPADVFVTKVWVSNENPGPDETVTIYGTLQRNGMYLNGVMMYATWPGPEDLHGLPNCSIDVIYQRGICNTKAGNYPSGVYVPIDISFVFRGKTYTGKTGFTPK